MKKFIKKEIVDKDIYKIFKPELSPKKMQNGFNTIIDFQWVDELLTLTKFKLKDEKFQTPCNDYS